MFLSYLNDEAKELFMDVALNVAAINQEITEDEKKTLDLYYQELGIEHRGYKARQNEYDTVQKLSKTTNLVEKKIVVFECVAIAYADGVIDMAENQYLKDMCDAFDMSTEILEAMKNLIVELVDVHTRIYNIVGI